MSAKLKKKYGLYWQLYLFLLLPLAYIIIFSYIPMAGVQIAFKDYSFSAGIWGSKWAGFKHFQRFFGNYMFGRTVWNTLRISLLGLALSFPFPIMFALALNSVTHERMKKTVQTITYMPHFISIVVMVGMLMQVFNSNVGLYGRLYQILNDARPPDLFAKPASFLSMYIGSGMWQNFGWGSILYLAALTNVSPEQTEAALVDGATRFQRLLHIDIPVIIPIFVIQLILQMGRIMTVGFEKVWLMQNDLNLQYSEVISTYVYKQSIGAGARANYSYSTAVGLFNSVIGLVLLVLVNNVARRVSEVSLW